MEKKKYCGSCADWIAEGVNGYGVCRISGKKCGNCDFCHLLLLLPKK